MQRVTKDPTPTDAELKVLKWFVRLSIKLGRVPKQTEVAKKTGISKQAVLQHMNSLADRGLMARPSEWRITRAAEQWLG